MNHKKWPKPEFSTYVNDEGETREIDDHVYAGWVSTGNPKAQIWQPKKAEPAK